MQKDFGESEANATSEYVERAVSHEDEQIPKQRKQRMNRRILKATSSDQRVSQ